MLQKAFLDENLEDYGLSRPKDAGSRGATPKAATQRGVMGDHQ
jgi:hypothetical protein